MTAFYELVGRIVVWVVRVRYARQLRVMAGAAVAGVAVAAYLAASREPEEG